MSATVTTGCRLHFGFANLSLAHDRIYGACGVTLSAPECRVRAERDDTVTVRDETSGPRLEGDCVGSGTSTAGDDTRDAVRGYTRTACALLDVPGARVTVERALPRHVGLGSGTQTALATLAAVAHAYDREPRVRERAPAVGRGGRSGVGVAAFERGGCVVDGGHPTERFTADRPADGEWTVPPVIARHPVPDDWRFLLVLPDADPGRAGDDEDRSVRETVTAADSEPADRIAGVICRQFLPAVATGARERFGEAVRAIGRANGAWFADSQGGVYRPPVGEIVAALAEEPAVAGPGQSSWGPLVYGVTDAPEEARAAGRRALEAADADGRVACVAGDSVGATVRRE